MSTLMQKDVLIESIENCLALIGRKSENFENNLDWLMMAELRSKLYGASEADLSFKELMESCNSVIKKYKSLPDCSSWSEIQKEAENLLLL